MAYPIGVYVVGCDDVAPLGVTFLLTAKVSPPNDVVELLRILVYRVYVGVVLILFEVCCGVVGVAADVLAIGFCMNEN